MYRRVVLLAASAATVVVVSSESPLFGNDRIPGVAASQKSITTLAPAPRATLSPQIDSISQSDGAALLLRPDAADNPRSTVGNSVDSPSSLGKITTSSVSKLILDTAVKTPAEAVTKSGESNPLLEALRWKGASSSQVGVPSELWCADFMNFILSQTGQSGTGSRAARSFLKYGKPISEPRVGAIVVFSRGSNGQSGHVGIVRGTDGGDKILVISGNHGKKVAESYYPKSRVLGYFLPPKGTTENMNAAANSVIAAGR